MNCHYDTNLAELSMIGNHRFRDVIRSLSFRKIIVHRQIYVTGLFLVKCQDRNGLYKMLSSLLSPSFSAELCVLQVIHKCA